MKTATRSAPAAAKQPSGKLPTMTEAFTPLAEGADRLALFTIEQIVNGLKHGFADPTGTQEEKRQTL